MLIVRRKAQGFTLVEMMVAMAIMGIVMTLAALEFKYVVYGYLFNESHLTAEQQARVAMAKVTNVAHQASVPDSSPNPQASSTPVAILEPLSTPGARLAFTQVASLNPSDMPVVNGDPVPCYNVVQLYVDSFAGVPSVGKLWEQVDPLLGSDCAGFDYSHMPLLLSRNIQRFMVEPIQNGQGYRVDLTIYDGEDHAIDNRAGATYDLTSVITPIVSGQPK